MLEALGYQFLDEKGEVIHPCGGNLLEIEQIIEPSIPLPKMQITLSSDVLNPLTGPNGATYTYGPQKGARDADLLILEKGLTHLATKVQRSSGKEVFSKKGYGAAGGFPLCACEVLHATIQSGSQLIFEKLGIEGAIKQSEVVITGEGKIDGQTAFGKAITPVLKCAQSHDKERILVCGLYENEDPSISRLARYELSKLAPEMNLDSFKHAYLLAFEAGRRIATRLKE